MRGKLNDFPFVKYELLAFTCLVRPPMKAADSV